MIDNVKSRDGDALVRAIDAAIAAGDWGDATEVWSYIKSTRRELRRDMSDEETALLRDFISKQKNHGIYVLSRGALETYLPMGYRSKDLDKLIRFVRSEDFWERLEGTGRDELSGIAAALLS